VLIAAKRLFPAGSPWTLSKPAEKSQAGITVGCAVRNDTSSKTEFVKIGSF